MLFQSVQNVLQHEKNVHLVGFGSFEVRERAAHEALTMLEEKA